MGARGVTVSGTEHPRYTVVSCTVVDHQRYGLVIQSELGQRGFVDRAEISDGVISVDMWPKVGDQIRGVVLGYTNDGRIRISARPRDVTLIESLAEPMAAMEEWRAIKETSTRNVIARNYFYKSPNAPALLRWALRNPPSSADRNKALELLSTAPVQLRNQLPSAEPFDQ